MVYFLGFALMIGGYTLVVWGVYYAQHRPASMAWLVSGKGTPPPAKPAPSPSKPGTGPANPFTNPFLPKLAPQGSFTA